MKRGLDLLSVLILVFALAGVSAQVIITPQSFSEEFNVSTQYDITINNTNSGQGANITELNFTIQGSFTFIGGTEGTSTIASFSNTSTVLTWRNETGYVVNSSDAGGNIQSFQFNLNASDKGDYNIKVEYTNSTGVYSQNISVIIDDFTDPSISYNDPTPGDGATLNKTYLEVNITASDNTAIDTITVFLYNSTESLIQSGQSSTSPALINFTGLNDGTYSVNATVNDSSGNKASTPTRDITIGTANASGTSGNQTCAPDWGCSGWSECVGGTQIRTCADSNSCEDNSTRPDEERNCEPCTEKWECADWEPEECLDDGIQTRTCEDVNSCGTEINKSSVERTCSAKSEGDLFFVIIIISISTFALLIFAGLIIYFKKDSGDSPDIRKNQPRPALPPGKPQGKPIKRPIRRMIPGMPRLPPRRGPPQGRRFPPRGRNPRFRR